MSTAISKFNIADVVAIDVSETDPGVTGTVTGLLWYSHGHHEVQVAWLHNGVSYSAWFDDWRLTKRTKGSDST